MDDLGWKPYFRKHPPVSGGETLRFTKLNSRILQISISQLPRLLFPSRFVAGPEPWEKISDFQGTPRIFSRWSSEMVFLLLRPASWYFLAKMILMLLSKEYVFLKSLDTCWCSFFGGGENTHKRWNAKSSSSVVFVGFLFDVKKNIRNGHQIICSAG